MSFAVTVKLICVCFLAHAQSFFHGPAHMSCHYKICFRTRSDTNQAVHLDSQENGICLGLGSRGIVLAMYLKRP